MGWARAALTVAAAVAAGVLLISGGSEADPETPAGLPGMPPPFLGVAVLGGGRLTPAVDAYGNVVDLRAPGPAGGALIENPPERQATGTVAADTGIQAWVRGGGRTLPMWRADVVRQRYLPGTNVLSTEARFGRARVRVRQAALGESLAIMVRSRASTAWLRVNAGLDCRRERDENILAIVCSPDRPGRTLAEARRIIGTAARSDRRWLRRARPLAEAAPAWAVTMYRRSLLVLHALTDKRTGAVAAGARDGWAYVWPRDAGAAALAYAAAGYRSEARHVASFLLRLDLGAAARFDGDGTPVPGRGPQGDAVGWVRVAARAAGLPAPKGEVEWRDLADYREGAPGDHLGNAIAAGDGSREEIIRSRDSAAAWAVRPFSQPALHPAVRAALKRLVADRTRFGITPSEDWPDEDPWSAPTAWTTWSLAALAERQLALQLIRGLRHSSTAAGAIPERVDAQTGVPRSTTPLAWSHAFAILALQELWPG